MSTYVDLVVVKLNTEKPYLFQAPAWSHLEKGAVVKVDTSTGLQVGTVIGSITVEDNLTEDEAVLLIDLLGATLPLAKIYAKVVDKRFTYPQTEEDPDE